MSRLAGAQAASQCPDWVPNENLIATAEGQKVAAFQSAFVLDDVFRQRLASMRDLVITSNIDTHTKAGKLAG
ncbi:MAG TPA: hypothetical protein PKA88_36415, partial [Polyangiaceae bacterium]|nr:hypothetical protein [Polyangiaceae bacterium]